MEVLGAVVGALSASARGASLVQLATARHAQDLGGDAFVVADYWWGFSGACERRKGLEGRAAAALCGVDTRGEAMAS